MRYSACILLVATFLLATPLVALAEQPASSTAAGEVVVPVPIKPVVSCEQIKEIFPVKRRPGISVEEFRKRYIAHGERVRNFPPTQHYLLRYVQNYASAASYAKGEPPFDGYTELWFRDATARAAFRENSEYRQFVVSDLVAFVDLTQPANMTVEEVVAIGKDGKACNP